ncbi:MAG: hypothetical protein TU35_009245 [Thermoproteus sp. AZ2]|jgi:hypothetical protein|uniref:Uncharacterized protein n=1 Tax=Thermoproteus sp. AZ2 TaxID=1609232 RepID=A0ACC6V3L7_9CREN|nr:MAG: hypothetical protein TU35_01125 [Thermoproteus sp. AZ2]
MSGVDERRVLSELALLMLEELALRGGRIKAKHWRTYRAVSFWAGEGTASTIVKRLAEGGFLRIEGDYVELAKPIKPPRGLKEIEGRALALAKSLYKG